MAIRFILEFDTPEEAAQTIARLPGLARALPAKSGNKFPGYDYDNQDRAHELTRPARYAEYQRNGGGRSFLGWAQEGEPPTPVDEIDQTPKK
jgi:hypothetical protein